METENAMCGLFGEVLGIDEVRPADDFFDLGGHSLLLAQLASAVRRELGVMLRIEDLVTAPTPGGLAKIIEDMGGPTRARRAGAGGGVL